MPPDQYGCASNAPPNQYSFASLIVIMHCPIDPVVPITRDQSLRRVDAVAGVMVNHGDQVVVIWPKLPSTSTGLSLL